MSRGQLTVRRRMWDSTVIPPGARFKDGHGHVFEVVREAYLHRQSKLTKFMRCITFGLWPWGSRCRVDVFLEERDEKAKR